MCGWGTAWGIEGKKMFGSYPCVEMTQSLPFFLTTNHQGGTLLNFFKLTGSALSIITRC